MMQKILKAIGIAIITVNIIGWIIVLLSMLKYTAIIPDNIYHDFFIPAWLGSFVALAIFIILYTLYTSISKKQDSAPEPKNTSFPLRKLRSTLYIIDFIIFLIALLIMFMQNVSYSWLGAVLFSLSALMALVLLVGFGIYDLILYIKSKKNQ
jgi:cellobiose-specific phosphotransferase system component IIC